MAVSYNLLPTTDAPQERDVRPSTQIRWQIANASVFVAVAEGAKDQRAPTFGPEELLYPGVYTDTADAGRTFDRVRFRSAVAGTPGLVTIAAF